MHVGLTLPAVTLPYDVGHAGRVVLSLVYGPALESVGQLLGKGLRVSNSGASEVATHGGGDSCAAMLLVLLTAHTTDPPFNAIDSGVSLVGPGLQTLDAAVDLGVQAFHAAVNLGVQALDLAAETFDLAAEMFDLAAQTLEAMVDFSFQIVDSGFQTVVALEFGGRIAVSVSHGFACKMI